MSETGSPTPGVSVDETSASMTGAAFWNGVGAASCWSRSDTAAVAFLLIVTFAASPV